ncbi:MAG: hypothetical protein ACLTW7_14430 [Enterococcus sp.]
MGTRVPISEYAEQLSTVPELSNVTLVRDQKYTVKDLSSHDRSISQCLCGCLLNHWE